MIYFWGVLGLALAFQQSASPIDPPALEQLVVLEGSSGLAIGSVVNSSSRQGTVAIADRCKELFRKSFSDIPHYDLRETPHWVKGPLLTNPPTPDEFSDSIDRVVRRLLNGREFSSSYQYKVDFQILDWKAIDTADASLFEYCCTSFSENCPGDRYVWAEGTLRVSIQPHRRTGWFWWKKFEIDGPAITQDVAFVALAPFSKSRANSSLIGVNGASAFNYGDLDGRKLRGILDVHPERSFLYTSWTLNSLDQDIELFELGASSSLSSPSISGECHGSNVRSLPGCSKRIGLSLVRAPKGPKTVKLELVTVDPSIDRQSKIFEVFLYYDSDKRNQLAAAVASGASVQIFDDSNPKSEIWIAVCAPDSTNDTLSVIPIYTNDVVVDTQDACINKMAPTQYRTDAGDLIGQCNGWLRWCRVSIEAPCVSRKSCVLPNRTIVIGVSRSNIGSSSRPLTMDVLTPSAMPETETPVIIVTPPG